MLDRYFKTILTSISSIFVVISAAEGQLIPDRTLGRESSTVVPVNNTRDDIRGGARRGSNLFHSFREFNVNTGRQVYFDNPPGVQNIINRVTGRNISNIFGTIGVNGNANLYLINPNGIVFGEGAFLDINGTFIGTTADGVRLGANDVYSATDPASSSLLTIQPEALFVNRKNAIKRAIINQDNLEVKSGGNLRLSGDSIENRGKITAFGGNVSLEAVNGDINVKDISTVDGINGGGDINISATGGITVEGIIDTSGGDFEVDNFGVIVNSPNRTANSGDVTLLARDNINFNNSSRIFAIGNFGGSINIETNSKILATDAFITSFSTGNVIGKGGDINVNARSIEFNNSGLFSDTQDITNTGNITINTDLMRITLGAQIGTVTFGQGNSGNLTITAGEIELIGSNPVFNSPSGLFAVTWGAGNGGFVSIDTKSLRLEDGAQISAGTRAGGNGGNLSVTAKTIELIGSNPLDARFPSGLFAQSIGAAEGDAGELTITTQDLLISDRAAIGAQSASTGNSGDININANRTRIHNNGRISVSSNVTGMTGDINIEGNSLALDRGRIDAESNIGQGGNINITLTESLSLGNESRITARAGVDRVGTGDGGNITIDSPLIIANPRDNIISADAFGGAGGNINITTNAILGVPQLLEIEASSSLGIDGTINITGITDLNSNLVRAEPVIISLTPLQLAECPLNSSQTALSSQNSDRSLNKFKVEVFQINNKDSTSDRTPAKPKPSQPAVGWYRKTDGTVVLTSNPALVRPLSQPIDYPSGCDN